MPEGFVEIYIYVRLPCPVGWESSGRKDGEQNRLLDLESNMTEITEFAAKPSAKQKKIRPKKKKTWHRSLHGRLRFDTVRAGRASGVGRLCCGRGHGRGRRSAGLTSSTTTPARDKRQAR